ncbi:MAG: hypothetical protein PVTTEEND_000060 [Candidatus Fervidibacter sp.]
MSLPPCKGFLFDAFAFASFFSLWNSCQMPNLHKNLKNAPFGWAPPQNPQSGGTSPAPPAAAAT